MDEANIKTAEEIVKSLSDWSKKYPRNRIYHHKEDIDNELIKIEEDAKEFTAMQPSSPILLCIEEKELDEYVHELERQMNNLFDENKLALNNSICDKILGIKTLKSKMKPITQVKSDAWDKGVESCKNNTYMRFDTEHLEDYLYSNDDKIQQDKNKYLSGQSD